MSVGARHGDCSGCCCGGGAHATAGGSRSCVPAHPHTHTIPIRRVQPPPVPVTMPHYDGPTKDTASSFAWTRATHPSCWLLWHPWRLRYDRAARLSVHYTLCLPAEAGRLTSLEVTCSFTCGVGARQGFTSARARCIEVLTWLC
jgi:hypothetical protein